MSELDAQNTAGAGPERVPPHTPLPQYYDTDPKRSRYVIDLFDRTAQHYDTIEMLFLNGGIWYRRFSLRRAGLRRGDRVQRINGVPVGRSWRLDWRSDDSWLRDDPVLHGLLCGVGDEVRLDVGAGLERLERRDAVDGR